MEQTQGKPKLINKFLLAILIIFIVLAIIIPFFYKNSVSGLGISNTEADEIIQGVKVHFDNPFQRMFVFSYQIVEKDSNKYLVVGRSLFGLQVVKASYSISNGFIETVE